MFEANLALYVPTAFLIMLTPGPANALIVAHAAGSMRAGLAATAGILASVAVLLTATILGVSALVLASQPAFLALKWAGAAYLAYLGVRMILAAGKSAAAAPSQGRALAEGFLTGVTNPKALIFYFAFVPQFLTDAAPVRDQLIGIGLVDIALATLVFGFYASPAQNSCVASKPAPASGSTGSPAA